MIYTPLTNKAMSLCYSAHAGQEDKSGVPYVFHPIHLAEQMDDELSVCVALLHDVMEDTETTEGDLRSEGFPDEAIDALLLMTHDPSVPYMDYVRALAGNEIARKVKLADLRHNSDLSRIPSVSEKDVARVEKYSKAIEFLESL